MKISIIALGTRGDLQPLIALAYGLKKTGHQLEIILDSDYEYLIKRYPFSYILINGVQTMFEQNTVINKMNNCYHACEESDAIIFSPHPFSVIGYHIAEKLDIPCFWASGFPSFSSPEIPDEFLPGVNIYGFYNQHFHYLLSQWREKDLKLSSLGLDPACPPWKRMREEKLPFLYFFSKHLLSKSSTWPDSAYISGFWFLDTHPEWMPSDRLLTFLENGAKSIYFNFGSVYIQNPDNIINLIQETIKGTHYQAIITIDKKSLKKQPDPSSILLMDSIPHSYLFNHVELVVHHGGVNTVGEILRAGVPSVPVPFMTDGPLWSHLLNKKGLCPKPVHYNQLSPYVLADSIHNALNDEDSILRLRKIKNLILSEKGVEYAVKIINNYFL